MQLTFGEIINILELKYRPSKKLGYFLTPSIWAKTNIIKILEYKLPDNVQVTFTIDDIRLKFSLKN